MRPQLDFQPLIHTITRHVPLTEDEVAVLCQHLVPRKIRKGHMLSYPGVMVTHTWFVLSGCLRLFLVDSSGDEHILQLAIDGWWIGDKRSFNHHVPTQLNLQALEDCELLECSRDSLYALFDLIPAFERYYRIISENAYIATQQRMLEKLSLTAEERYQQFHSRYAAFESRISQKDVASYLGCTPEYLSRIKKEMRHR